ncbi:tol-pal system protein YbgF [Ferruginivarius sediminum]|uniref:Cell division coordinator CpoB n=2 Tax=Ferruginivarius sediminum TaxID=2661937 RepID=A0A369T488_9PROT|nr:tol-pal system protein YbgF [Ferruginivarius sediminum]
MKIAQAWPHRNWLLSRQGTHNDAFRMPMTLPSFRFSRWISAIAVSFAMVFAATGPASAQSDREIRSLTQKVERLQRELNVLQRAIYNDEEPPEMPSGAAESGTSGTAAASGGLSQTGAARIQRRLDQLEQDLGHLTGQVEETRFQMRQVGKRLDKLVTDVDFRLRELEDRIGGGQAQAEAQGGAETGQTAQAGQDAGTASSGTGKAAQTQQEAASASGGASEGGEPGTLGQVSQDAVEAIRSQEKGPAEETQTSSAADGYALPEGDATAQYGHAFGLLRQADYAKAEQALRAFVDAHPEHELAGNAKYWLGETYYVRGNYSEAAVTFAEGFQNYPDSNKAPDNLLKLGMSLAQIDRTEDACGIFAELLSRYPDSARNILQRAQREQQRLGCGG